MHHRSAKLVDSSMRPVPESNQARVRSPWTVRELLLFNGRRAVFFLHHCEVAIAVQNGRQFGVSVDVHEVTWNHGAESALAVLCGKQLE